MELQSRSQLLASHDVLASYLLAVQRLIHEPRERWKAGQSVVLHTQEEAVVLSAEQATQLNVEEQAYFEQHRDKYKPLRKYTSLGRCNMIAPGSNGTEYLAALSKSLARLTEKFGSLLVLGEWPTPWLHQDNDYPPVAAALSFLRQNIAPDFSGGFKLTAAQVEAFIPQLFWLVRCNAALPYVMMSYEDGQTVLEICKYGVLHLDFFDAREQQQLLGYFQEHVFQEVADCYSPVAFDHFEGRRIMLD